MMTQMALDRIASLERQLEVCQLREWQLEQQVSTLGSKGMHVNRCIRKSFHRVPEECIRTDNTTDRIAHLERQVTDLQTRNTELVEENRKLLCISRSLATLGEDFASARVALRKVASRTYDSTTKLFEPNAAQSWLDEHPNE